ncbi:MAG: hypothetical protein AAGU14_00265 [Eubacteriaceae bacterium]
MNNEENGFLGNDANLNQEPIETDQENQTENSGSYGNAAEFESVMPQEGKTKKVREKKPGGIKKVLKIAGISIAALIVLFIIIGMLIPSPYSAKEITDKMASAMSKNIGSNNISDIVEYSESTDPNKLLGKEGEYIGKTSFKDKRLKSTDDNVMGGTIEVFDSLQSLELRKYKIETVYALSEQAFEKFGSYSVYGTGPKMTMFVENNAILRIDSEGLDENAINAYGTAFKQVMNTNKDFKDKTIMTDSELALKKDEIYNKIELLIADNVKQLEDKLAEIKSNVETAVVKAEKSLNRTDLSDAKDAVAGVYADYFSVEVKNWNSRLTTVDNKIVAAEKAAIQKELDARTKTLSAGKYTVGKDIKAGLFDAIAVSGGGNFIIHDKYGSLKVNEILGVKDPSFYLRKYSNLQLKDGDEIDIRSTLKVKFQAK